jgi:internalin A
VATQCETTAQWPQWKTLISFSSETLRERQARGIAPVPSPKPGEETLELKAKSPAPSPDLGEGWGEGQPKGTQRIQAEVRLLGSIAFNPEVRLLPNGYIEVMRPKLYRRPMKTLALLSTLLLALLPVAPADAWQARNRSFKDWCVSKTTLPASAQKTVNALLEVAETQDCQAADNHLRNLTRLNLDHKGLSNLEPISALTQLTHLELQDNQVQDLSPLTDLANLTSLDLSINRISKLQPLIPLTQLYQLRLAQNKITDISPLADLTGLYGLDLQENKITNIRPLLGLTNLGWLLLQNNRIQNVKPLAKLTKIFQLGIRSNALRIQDCPLRPISICDDGNFEAAD